MRTIFIVNAYDEEKNHVMQECYTKYGTATDAIREHRAEYFNWDFQLNEEILYEE